jgi:signal peptidase I
VSGLTEPTASPETAPAPAPASRWRAEALELLRMVASFLVMFWLLKTYVIEGYEVQGPSMYPTITERERILVFKLPHNLAKLPFLHGLQAVEAGDIVVFDSNDEVNKRYIKRVIAAGPPRPAANTVSAKGPDPEDAQVRVRFERGAVYVNRERLEEDYLPAEQRVSRDVDSASLKPGEYYVLGDNRGESKDSRSFGPVVDEQVIGTALLRIWPPSKFGMF